MGTRSGLRGLGVTTVAVAAVLATAYAAQRYASPERVLARGYGQALGDFDTSWGSRHAGNIWLSDAPAGGFRSRGGASPTAGATLSVTGSPGVDAPGMGTPGMGTTTALAIGDRISIAARTGGQDEIEVVELEEVDGAGLGLAGTRFQIVTGRHLGAAAETTVRFLFAVDQPRAASAPPKGHGRSL